MEWTADVSDGDWIRERLDVGHLAGSIHTYVPRGFAAYARVFHRPLVSWAEGRAYPTQDELRESDPGMWPETFSADTTWAEAARVFGTELHGTAQWNRIVRRGADVDGDGIPALDWQQVIGRDGREYSQPAEGSLDAAQLSAVATHLMSATSTPADIRVALWDGWGGIVGHLGHPSTAAVAFMSDDPELIARHSEMLARSTRDPFNNVFRKPTWQKGLLSDEASRGGRFSLPDRDHVLFRADIAEFTDADWAERVPWAERVAAWTQSPSLIWPTDRAWALVTEIDFDSTIVGGSAELVRALCTDPALEALPIREGADLTWDADEVNR